DAVGEVLLELPVARRQRPLPRPVGLAVRILRRGPGQYPGLAACTALGAWVEEWALGDHATAEGHAIFVGMPGNPLVERWCGEQLERIPRLHMHRPRHLGAPLGGPGRGLGPEEALGRRAGSGPSIPTRAPGRGPDDRRQDQPTRRPRGTAGRAREALRGAHALRRSGPRLRGLRAAAPGRR